MNSELVTFLRTRRTVRRFKSDPLAPGLLEQLLETAVFSPSAQNRQPWRFVVVNSPEKKTFLGEAFAGRFRGNMENEGAAEEQITERTGRVTRRPSEAPAVVVLCRQMEAGLHPADERMDEQSVAMAGLQLLLAAHAHGLAGNWICWPLLAPEETRQVLDLPDTWAPEAMVFIGYPAEDPLPPARKPQKEITLSR